MDWMNGSVVQLFAQRVFSGGCSQKESTGVFPMSPPTESEKDAIMRGSSLRTLYIVQKRIRNGTVHLINILSAGIISFQPRKQHTN